MSFESRKILFVTYGGGHVDIVNRLVPHIVSESGLDYEILALTTAGASVERMGFHFKRCRDYLPLAEYERAMELGSKLSKGTWNESSGIPFGESCAYLGISMLDLIDELGEDKAWKAYREDERKSFCPKRFLGRVLDLEKPDLVVTTCHVRMERAAVIAAKSRGLVSTRIEDLFGFSMLGDQTLDINQVVVAESEWPDHILVMNGYIRNRMLEAGIPKERVHVTGQPVFSEWVAKYHVTPPEERLISLRQNGKPIVTFASPAHRGFLYEQAKVVVDLAQKRKDWQFCIKLHPSVSMGEFFHEMKNIPTNIIVLQQEDILPVVKSSDVVVLFRSTVGLLCIFCGVPLVVINWTDFPEPLSYISSGAATGVEDHEGLELAITESLCKRQQYTSTSNLPPVYENPPNSAQEIVKCITSTLNQ